MDVTASPSIWNPTKEQVARWQNAANSEQALPLIRECWGDLVEAEPCGGYLPLFDSPVVEQVIKRVLSNAIEIRTGRKRQGNGASVLITGVKGVGKTTIMKGICRILQGLEPNTIWIYHNFEHAQPQLVDLLRPVVKLPPGNITFEEVLARIAEAKNPETGLRDRGLAMFLDEIQVLYVPRYRDGQPNTDHREFVKIVTDIQRLGKTGPQAFGVVSGSASNTRHCAYRKADVAIDGSYPNLNETVYVEYVLKPEPKRNEFEKGS